MIRLLLALGLAACASTPPSPPPSPEAAAAVRPAPQPTRTVDGPALSAWLAEPSGRVRVVNFWATWCPPCIAEMPMLRTFAFRHPQVEVVLVNVDHSTVQGAKVPIVVQNHGLDSLNHLWLSSTDPNRTLRESVEGWPAQLPTTLVIGPDGKRVGMLIEAVQPSDLDALVQRAAAAP